VLASGFPSGISIRYSLSWVIKDHPDLAVSQVMESIKPNHLRKPLRDDREFAYADLEKTFRGFMNHVISRAQHFGEFEDPKETVVEKPSPNHLSAAYSGRKHISHTVSSQSAALKSTAARSAPSRLGKIKTLPDCLNPQCKGYHYLKDCTFTTQELKYELYAARAILRKQQGDKRTTRAESTTDKYRTSITNSSTKNQTAAKSLRSTPAQTQLEGRFPVFFESSVSMIALPDLGADDNVSPRSVLLRLEADGI
jgi:hypothetical protein